MCQAAFDKNLISIGFSGHSPNYKKTGIKTKWNMSEEATGEYIAQVLEAKKRWRGKLDVYLGLEVDYIKGLRCAIDDDIKELNLDYTIGSVHYVVPSNGIPLFTVDGQSEEFINGLNEGYGGRGEMLMHSYYDALAEMIAIGGFDILGHADILKKNCENKNYWNAEIEAVRQREIAKAAAQANIVVEVNTGGLTRKKINDMYPSLGFLRLFCEYGVPAIITADAHRAEHINGNYDVALQTLINAGYSEHVLFCGKNNGKAVYKKEIIQKNEI
jgi:histidinol-phosphatase (PHP family)